MHYDNKNVYLKKYRDFLKISNDYSKSKKCFFKNVSSPDSPGPPLVLGEEIDHN